MNWIDFAWGANAGVPLGVAFTFAIQGVARNRVSKRQPELKPACNSKYHAKYSVGETAFSQIIMCQRYEHEGIHCCNLGSGYQTVGFTWSDQESIEPPTEPSSAVEVPDVFAEAWGEKPQEENGSRS